MLHPGGIQVSAGRATRALAARVIDAGGQLAVRNRVTGLMSSDRRVTGVRTDAGPIRAQAVVLACTELVLAVDVRANVIPVYDTTAMHARAAVDWMLAEEEQARAAA